VGDALPVAQLVGLWSWKKADSVISQEDGRQRQLSFWAEAGYRLMCRVAIAAAQRL